MLRWLEVWFFVVGLGRSPSRCGCVGVSDFYVVAEQLLLVRSMASPQRLEEGLPGLPGMPMMPGMPGAAGTATAAVGAVGLGQGSVNGQGLGSDPWAGVAVDSSSSRETLRNKRGRGTLEQ